MTQKRVPRDFNPERVYRRLGEFIVALQWFEDTLLDMITKLVAPERFFAARAAFLSMRFAEKIRVAEHMFLQVVEELGREGDSLAAQWSETFREICNRLTKLNEQRNKVVHSSYVELMAGGALKGIVLAKERIKRGAALHDYSDPIDELDSALRGAGALALELSRAATQVTHWAGRRRAIPKNDDVPDRKKK